MPHLTCLNKRNQIRRKKNNYGAFVSRNHGKTVRATGQTINLTKLKNAVRLSPINPGVTSLTASN